MALSISFILGFPMKFQPLTRYEKIIINTVLKKTSILKGTCLGENLSNAITCGESIYFQ